MLWNKYKGKRLVYSCKSLQDHQDYVHWKAVMQVCHRDWCQRRSQLYGTARCYAATLHPCPTLQEALPSAFPASRPAPLRCRCIPHCWPRGPHAAAQLCGATSDLEGAPMDAAECDCSVGGNCRGSSDPPPEASHRPAGAQLVVALQVGVMSI